MIFVGTVSLFELVAEEQVKSQDVTVNLSQGHGGLVLQRASQPGLEGFNTLDVSHTGP